MRRVRESIVAAAVLLVATVEAGAQMSIDDLRTYGDSYNLELVTLQGIVHLVNPYQQQLGGSCGLTGFMLQDDTGAIPVAVRRVARLVEPLQEGDLVQVTAQIRVLRTSDNVPLLVCVEATQIQHLGQ